MKHEDSAAVSTAANGPLHSPEDALPAPPIPETSGHAFFFDMDGTLVDYAERPELARADRALLQLLARLRERSGGALALVSGRSIMSLDALTHPEQLCASGLHGFEVRAGADTIERHDPPQPHRLDELRALLSALATEFPGVYVEDKQYALAVHYRHAPEHAAAIAARLEMVPGLEAAGLRLQRGHLVLELAPAAVNKASALAQFMRNPPFRGRLPVYVGDDLTDEPAFHWVNLAHGLSVAVRPRGGTAARYGLPSVSAVHAWVHAVLGGPA